MKKIILLVVAVVLGWFTVAQAEVWRDPNTPKDETYASGEYRISSDGNPYDNSINPVIVVPSTDRQSTADQNRHLDRYKNQGNTVPNMPVLNPYVVFRW
jgi:hypothetical protein